MLTRYTLLHFFFLSSMKLFSQGGEDLSPLKFETDLSGKPKSFAAIYIYEVDTLGLPLQDDFSTDKFRKYNAKPGDANVTSIVEFLLENGGTPYPAGTGFSTAQTYQITYDTLPGGGDTLMFVPLSGTSITVNDLTQYPVVGISQVVYPCYNILDTVFSPSPDTIYTTCDLVQDSVYIYFVSSIDQSSAIWLDSYAYRNYRWAVNPPTLGVVTFDGIDENGYPYEFSIPTTVDYADALTSKPIDLSSTVVGDSIYLSFFYQPQGLGDDPESGDSLILEFYTPSTVTWKHIWGVNGTTLKNFKQILIPIKDIAYFSNAFQFRFRNYGSITGSIDHWQLDYVFLDRFRFATDTIRDDVAFRYQGRTLLNNNYSSMPWTHFMTAPDAFMRDTLSVFQRNNNSLGRLVGFNNSQVNYKGTTQFSGNNPATPSISGLTDFKTLFDIKNAGFIYDTSVNDTSAVFDIMFTHNTTPDDCRGNDTMRFSQEFSNYYSYDDGTAEAAYGPIGVGAQLAYGFNVVKPDTLFGIAIHFSPSVYNLDNKTFFLTVWDASGSGGSPGSIVYQETLLSDVVYGNVQNKFYTYAFSSPIVVSGNIYIGWEQTDLDKLNIGFDKNYNSSSKIFYNLTGTWANTAFQGSLMMRPVFKWKANNYTIGVNEFKIKPGFIDVYPNPAKENITIVSEDEIFELRICDITGKGLTQITLPENTIDVSFLTNGVYFIHARTNAGIAFQKFIISK